MKTFILEDGDQFISMVKPTALLEDLHLWDWVVGSAVRLPGTCEARLLDWCRPRQQSRPLSQHLSPSLIYNVI